MVIKLCQFLSVSGSSLIDRGIALPPLSHAKIESLSYGDWMIKETKPKKLFKSVTEGSAEPEG